MIKDLKKAILLALSFLLTAGCAPNRLSDEEIAANQRRSRAHDASYVALNIALVDDLGYSMSSVDLKEYGDLGDSGIFSYAKGTVKIKDGNGSYIYPYVLSYFHEEDKVITDFCLLKVNGQELISDCDRAMIDHGIAE